MLVRREAQVEIDRAVIWYEQKQVGLGSELLDEVAQVLRTVEQRPESFPVDYRTARPARLDRFPYAVYFRLTDDLISVIAFLHGSQDKEDRLRLRA